MKRIFSIPLCLATLSLAYQSLNYYALEDFAKNSERTPNKCVNKGVTYKCVGYDEIEGAIFNTKTMRLYVYTREYTYDRYSEYQCEYFYVEVDKNDDEKIICIEGTPVKEMICKSSLELVKTIDYDELGIIIDEKIKEKGDAAICRNTFHHQYGNEEGEPYQRKTPKKSLKIPNDVYPVSREQKEYQRLYKDMGTIPDNSGGIGDGLAGLLGGGGGGIATIAKGSIKIPSERDILIDSNNGSRTTSDIMKIVRQQTPGLRHIYNKYLKQKPGFQGQVTLKFTIAPSGEITKIRIVSATTNFPDFEKEIKQAVRRWNFGKSNSERTTVTIPFTFSE